MTAAERLRMELASSFPMTKDEFIALICEGIKTSGRRDFICDRHIRRTDRSTIRIVDEHAAIVYAKSEGFSYHYEYNSYGVRKIIFTL